jgi:hypothetical protein
MVPHNPRTRKTGWTYGRDVRKDSRDVEPLGAHADPEMEGGSYSQIF